MASPALASAAPSGAGPLRLRPFDPERDAGPATAWLQQRAFALVLLCAWLSLGRQVRILIGERGLLPAAELIERARAAEASYLDLPTPFWLGCSDALLVSGTVLGGVLAVLALVGVAPRACFLLSAPLYLGYVAVAQDFLAFQWDNLLVESTLLLACLPAYRPSRLGWLVLRLLLFKLYFESGIAKWQSHLHDWQDGSAMTHYFETAPLPAALAYWAHQLPQRLLELSSFGALVLELPLPLLMLGPRAPRLLACVALTAFQVINTLTANYGFFTYMAAALHVALLCDADATRLARALRIERFMPAPRAPAPSATRTRFVSLGSGALGIALGSGALATWLAMSLISARLSFGGEVARDSVLRELHALYAPLRVANTYHLFGHITRERIEPQVEIASTGTGAFREHDLRYKPGDPARRPPYVAPHQPRVDFRLWFYGLSSKRHVPAYLQALLARVCDAPEVVQDLFAAPLPEHPDAVRIAFHRYRFTTSEEHARTGAWWRRERLGELPARSCR